jgi:hypothetical protein
MKCLSGWRNDDFVSDPSGYLSPPTPVAVRPFDRRFLQFDPDSHVV